MGRVMCFLRMAILILLFVALCGAASDSETLVLRPIASEYQHVPTKAGGCNFGFLHYDIGDSWHPDITPFGVMFCLICTCTRIPNVVTTGKVTCRNIRHRCPSTACARPKVEPGHCCPSCPDEFISLLTTPRASVSRQNGLGRAHFTLVRNTLSISIRYEGQRKLRMAAFMDTEGSVVKEMNIQRRSINGSQVCLVWNQLNNKQIESLKQGKISFELKLKRQQAAGLKGDIVLYKSYSEESFEALLSSDDETSSALASFNLVKSGKLLRMHLRYSGSHTVGSATQVTIKLVRTATSNKGLRVVKVISASQVKQENSVFRTSWTNPAQHALKWLSRGNLEITMILNTADQTTKLTGRIGIKRTCNTIVCQLSGRDAPRPTITGASGYASFEFINNGKIRYQIFLSGLIHNVTQISLQATNRGQNVKRLSRLLTADEYGRAKVTGIWERPSFTEICWLFSGNMFMNVRTTANTNGEIHGQLKQFTFRGHHLSYHDPPILLSGNEVVPRIQTGAAGQAWFSLDKNCALHYHLMFSGMDRGRRNLMTAELQGFADYGEVPQPYDEHVHFLRSFEGETVSGYARNLDLVFLSNLVRGLVYLQVSSEEVPQGELRSQVLVNSDICRKRFPDLQQGAQTDGSCFHGDKDYYNGQTWISEDDKCTSCTCEDSEIVCSPLQCQPLNCTEAPILLPHLCCPVCPATEEKVVIYYEKKNRPSIKGCYVKRDRKVYPAGAVWHPFVQPFGYMRCHACTCLAKSEEITCTKVKCPDLQCKNPIKMRMTDCCMRCPDDEDEQSDDGKVPKKGCSFRGNKYKHDQTWKPFIPLLPSRCITCKCENGKTKCRRPQCPKGQCRNSIDGASTSCCVPCSGS